MRVGRITRNLYLAGALALAFAAMTSSAGAAPLQLFRELEGPGLSVAAGGAGLLRGRSATLTVDVAGPVSLALLVWSGRGPCRTDPASGECGLGSEPFLDQILQLDGATLKGEVAGIEVRPGDERTRVVVSYVADVTEAVAARGPGRLTFTVADADRRNDLQELEGAGLLVAFTDPAVATTYRLAIRLGLDFAYGESETRDETRATHPFSFIHGAAKGTRRAELLLFTGGAEANRPDRIDVSHNPSLDGRLDSGSGASWDAERIPVEIPGGVGTTTVQIFSEPVFDNPDSVSWVLAALRLPLAAPAGCPASFWNARTDAWRGMRPSQSVGNLFNLRLYPSLAGADLRLALRFKDGPGLLGAAKALLREGTAARLNAGHPEIEFPLTTTQAVRRVSDALATRDPATVLATAEELAAMNAAGCPLD